MEVSKIFFLFKWVISGSSFPGCTGGFVWLSTDQQPISGFVTAMRSEGTPLWRLGRSEKKWSEFSRILLLMAEIRRSQVEVGSLTVNHGMPYLVQEFSYQYFIISFHGKNDGSPLKCTQFIRKSSMWVLVDHSQKRKHQGLSWMRDSAY